MDQTVQSLSVPTRYLLVTTDATLACHCNCHSSPLPTPLTRTYTSSTEETADNLPGPGRALDNLYQYLGRKLERALGAAAQWAGLMGVDQADATHQCCCSCPSSTSPMFPLSRTYTNETADNLPGPGRALDNFYQFYGRKLERGLGDVADKAGFGPTAAGRKVEKAARIMYSSQYRLRANGRLEKLRLEVAKREVRQGCKALTKYSQSALPSTQLCALSTILVVRTEYYRHTDTHFNEVESTKKTFSTTYHRLHEIETSSESFDLWNSLYEDDFDEDALSRLLRTSRTVLLSVENNHFNSLVQRMMDPTPSDIYARPEHEPLRTDAEIKSCWMEFFNYMLHPELSSLAFLYFNSADDMNSEFRGCLSSNEDMVVELCLKLFLILPNDYLNRDWIELPLAFRFIHRDKRWIDKQLRLLDDPKKTANPVTVEPAVLDAVALDVESFAINATGRTYSEMPCPSSSLLERYKQVRREVAPLSEDDERQLRWVCGWIARYFNEEDRIVVRNAIPGIDEYWDP